MIVCKYVWLSLNVILIFLILIRSPDEQSLQEMISPLNVFESSTSAEEKLDNLIQILIICYFVLGFFLIPKGS